MSQNKEVGSISVFRTWEVRELKPGIGIHWYDPVIFYGKTGEILFNLKTNISPDGYYITRQSTDDNIAYIRHWSSGTDIQGQISLKGILNSSELFLSGDKNTASEFPGMVITRGNVPLTKTDDYSVVFADFGKSIRMNSATAKTFTLPSVGEDEDGAVVQFMRQGAGKLTIGASDSDKIGESGYTSIYNEAVGEYGIIELEYVHAITTWVPTSQPHGMWIPAA